MVLRETTNNKKTMNIKLIEGAKRTRYARNGAMVKSYKTSRLDMNDGYHVFEWGTGDKMIVRGSDINKIYDPRGMDLYKFVIDGVNVVSELNEEEIKAIVEEF